MRMRVAVVLASLILAFGCSDTNDPAGDGGDAGDDIFLGDGANNGAEDTGDELDTNDPDTGRDTAEPDTADTGEDEPDVADPDLPDAQADVREMVCDRDNDGVMSEECGGDDCDDLDRTRAPGIEEYCDEVDNDCDGEINQGLNCWFYGHTGDALYEVDPFKKTIRRVADVPNLFDMDTHPDGTLYGVSPEALYRFDAEENRWVSIGELDDTIEDANGLAIDSTGVAFVTAMNDLWTIDLETASVSRVGSLGGDYYSSGDCVVNKFDSLFMTSKDLDDREAGNEFVIVDRRTGEATLVGDVGFARVYALTAGWGRLFGMTSRGELIEIDRNTAEGTLVATFEGERFYGAASTPAR